MNCKLFELYITQCFIYVYSEQMNDMQLYLYSLVGFGEL